MPGTSELGGQHQGTELPKATSGARNGFVRPVAVANIFRPAAYDGNGDPKPTLPEKRRPSAARDFKVIGSALTSEEFSRRRQSWDTRQAVPPAQELLKKLSASPSLLETSPLDSTQPQECVSGEPPKENAGLPTRVATGQPKDFVESKEPPPERSRNSSDVIQACHPESLPSVKKLDQDTKGANRRKEVSDNVSSRSKESLLLVKKNLVSVESSEKKVIGVASSNDSDLSLSKNDLPVGKLRRADGKSDSVVIQSKQSDCKVKANEVIKKGDSLQNGLAGDKIGNRFTAQEQNINDASNINVSPSKALNDLKSVKEISPLDKSCEGDKELTKTSPVSQVNLVKGRTPESDDSHVPSSFKTVRRTSDVIAARIQTIFSGKPDKPAALSSINKPRPGKCKADIPVTTSVPKHLPTVVQQNGDPGIGLNDSIVEREINNTPDSAILAPATKPIPCASGNLKGNVDGKENERESDRNLKNVSVKDKVISATCQNEKSNEAAPGDNKKQFVIKTSVSNPKASLDKHPVVPFVEKETVERVGIRNKSGISTSTQIKTIVSDTNVTLDKDRVVPVVGETVEKVGIGNKSSIFTSTQIKTSVLEPNAALDKNPVVPVAGKETVEKIGIKNKSSIFTSTQVKTSVSDPNAANPVVPVVGKERVGIKNKSSGFPSTQIKTSVADPNAALDKDPVVPVVGKVTAEKLVIEDKSSVFTSTPVTNPSSVLSNQCLPDVSKQKVSKFPAAPILATRDKTSTPGVKIQASEIRPDAKKTTVPPTWSTGAVSVEQKKAVPEDLKSPSVTERSSLQASPSSERKTVILLQKQKAAKPCVQGAKENQIEKSNNEAIKIASEVVPKEKISSATQQPNDFVGGGKHVPFSGEPNKSAVSPGSGERLSQNKGILNEKVSDKIASGEDKKPKSPVSGVVNEGEPLTSEKKNSSENCLAAKSEKTVTVDAPKGTDAKIGQNTPPVSASDNKVSISLHVKESIVSSDVEQSNSKTDIEKPKVLKGPPGLSSSEKGGNFVKKLKTQIKKSSEDSSPSPKVSKRSLPPSTTAVCSGAEERTSTKSPVSKLPNLELTVTQVPTTNSDSLSEPRISAANDCSVMIEVSPKVTKSQEHKIYNLEKEEVINVTLKSSADAKCPMPNLFTESTVSSDMKVSELRGLDKAYSPTPALDNPSMSGLNSELPRPPERKRSGLLRDTFVSPPPRVPLRNVSRTGSLKRAEDYRYSFDRSMSSILRSSSQSSMAQSHSYLPQQRYSYTEMFSKLSSFGLNPPCLDSASNRKLGVPQVSELWADLNEEQSSGAHTSEMLEAETTERMRLEKETQELQSRYSHMQHKSDKMELEMMEARVYRSEVNGDVSEDEDAEAAGSIYKQKYERAVRDMEIMKRRLQQQHEEEMEQKQMIKKATDKRLAEALEDVEEEKQVVNQWKRKAQKLGSELQDLRLMLEEQMARNGELEKKQRRFDADLSTAQEEIKKERQLREKLQRERDQSQLEKYSLEQELHSTRLDMDMQHEKVTQLNKELDELTLSSKGEEEVTQLKRAKQELERKARDQEEELEELAGQAQMLEQAKLRLEMSLEKLRQEHRREISVREEEIEEIRAGSSKKIKNLEAQLESEQEDRHQLVKQKHELERHIIELSDQPPPQDPEIERRLRRDLKRTKALFRDAQSMLEQVRDSHGGKTLIRQLKNQLEDAEFTKTVAVKARQSAELELQDLQSQLEEVTRTKNEAESRYLQLSREKSAFQTQLEEMEEEMAEVMKKYKAVVSQMSTDQKSMVEQNQQISELESEKQALKEQLSEMSSKLDHFVGQSEDTNRVHRLDAKVRDLESKLELEQTTHSRLEHQMARLKEQYDRMREECDSLRNKELQAQEATRRLQRQIREMREDYAALQQKESEAYRKQHELEIALENTEADLQVTKNDLRLACQRIQDLQNALEDDLDSGTDVPDDSGSDSDSSLDASLLGRRQYTNALQRSDSLSSNASTEIDGRQFRIASLSQDLSDYSKMMRRRTSMDFLI